MSNHETVTCDYAGCRKPFAYRVKGFNLCSEHLMEGESHDSVEVWLRKEQVKAAETAK